MKLPTGTSGRVLVQLLSRSLPGDPRLSPGRARLCRLVRRHDLQAPIRLRLHHEQLIEAGYPHRLQDAGNEARWLHPLPRDSGKLMAGAFVAPVLFQCAGYDEKEARMSGDQHLGPWRLRWRNKVRVDGGNEVLVARSARVRGCYFDIKGQGNRLVIGPEANLRGVRLQILGNSCCLLYTSPSPRD